MPKIVRIENADSNDGEIIVEVWTMKDGKVDNLSVTHSLPHPTALVEIPVSKDEYIISVRQA